MLPVLPTPMRARACPHADEAGIPARRRVATSATRRAISRGEGVPRARPRWCAEAFRKTWRPARSRAITDGGEVPPRLIAGEGPDHARTTRRSRRARRRRATQHASSRSAHAPSAAPTNATISSQAPPSAATPTGTRPPQPLGKPHDATLQPRMLEVPTSARATHLISQPSRPEWPRPHAR